MKARLEGGPFDGRNRPWPLNMLPPGLALWECPGLDCGVKHPDNEGDPLHGRALPTDLPLPDGAVTYRLVAIDEDGALYRYGQWVAPASHRTTNEQVPA